MNNIILPWDKHCKRKLCKGLWKHREAFMWKILWDILEDKRGLLNPMDWSLRWWPLFTTADDREIVFNICVWRGGVFQKFSNSSVLMFNHLVHSKDQFWISHPVMDTWHGSETKCNFRQTHLSTNFPCHCCIWNVDCCLTFWYSTSKFVKLEK